MLVLTVPLTVALATAVPLTYRRRVVPALVMTRWVQAVVAVPGAVTVIALLPTKTVPRHWLPEVTLSR